MNQCKMSKWYFYLIGREVLPKEYKIGSACRKNKDHSVEGKSVRYKSTNACVACAKENKSKERASKSNLLSDGPSRLDIDRKRRELEESKTDDWFVN